jgi:uncharacterized protein (DUF1330 family)
MSALMIATITVNDPAKFQEYLTLTQQVAAPYGAELVHRGTVDKDLTADGNAQPDHQMTVIVKFPSTAAIDRWYGSDAYQALIPLRLEGSDMKMVSYAIAG